MVEVINLLTWTMMIRLISMICLSLVKDHPVYQSIDKSKENNYGQREINRVATSHGNHGNHGKVMELFLVMEKVMEFQNLPNSHGKVMEVFYKDYILFFFINL